MSRAKQTSFFKRQSDEFGGSLLTSNPKTKRPLDSKLPIHLVLRAEQSRMRLPKYFAKIGKIVESSRSRHGVKIYSYENVGNHLHILIKIRSRASWAAFIREVTGRIALLTKTTWKYRPFTRVIRSWRKAFHDVKNYVYLNWLEGERFIKRDETRTLKNLQAIWGDP